KKERVERFNWSVAGGRRRGRLGGGLDADDDDDDGSKASSSGTRSGAGGTSSSFTTAFPAKRRGAAEGDLLQCEHFEQCPGCAYDRDFTATPIMVDARTFCQSLLTAGVRARSGRVAVATFAGASGGNSGGGADGGVPRFEVYIGDVHGWRTHAKLAVAPAGKYGGVPLGLYQAGSHNVVAIPRC
ncbi:unnamed protein product, partial [Phaeothamnion confervicola]